MAEKGEQGATAIWTRAPGPGYVQLPRQALGVRKHRIEVFDQLVRREAAVRRPQVHRAAGRDQAEPELLRRLHLRLDQSRAPAREHVVVVEDGRASGRGELGQPGARGGVLGLCVDSRPERIEGPQPGEQVGLGRMGTRERLVEVVMRVDETGRDESAAQIDTRVRVRNLTVSDPRDELVLDEQPTVRDLSRGVVHRDDVRACIERLHALSGTSSKRSTSTSPRSVIFRLGITDRARKASD